MMMMTYLSVVSKQDTERKVLFVCLIAALKVSMPSQHHWLLEFLSSTFPSHLNTRRYSTVPYVTDLPKVFSSCGSAFHASGMYLAVILDRTFASLVTCNNNWKLQVRTLAFFTIDPSVWITSPSMANILPWWIIGKRISWNRWADALPLG